MLKTACTVLLTISILALTITSSQANTTTCPSPVSDAFTGCYYSNLALEGDPTLVRTDSRIAFEWGNVAPDRSLPNEFSVRWQGYFSFNGGQVVFTAITSDGMRIYVDGVNVLDRWRDQPPYIYTVRPTLSPGSHLITVEYYQRSGWGNAGLSWEQQSAPAQPPVIQFFRGTPSAIAAGQTATLSWSVSGATKVSLDNGIGDVSSVVVKTITPSSSVVYTLTASNGYGTVSSGTSITVNSTSLPQQIQLPTDAKLSPGDTIPFPVVLASVAPAGGVFITLSSSDPTIATLTPNYIFITEGRTTPTSAPKLSGLLTGMVTLTASASAMATSSAVAQVGSPIQTSARQPVINSFTANPAGIVAGQSTTLSWNVSGAQTILLDNGVGDVSGATMKVLTPTQTTQYTLTAVNSAGSTLAHLTVVVTAAPTPQPPTPPVLVSAIAKSSSEIDLAWTASSCSREIAGYQILRNGVSIDSVSGTMLAYANTGLTASTLYSYSVRAYDAAASYSNASNTQQATTPASTSDATILTSCQAITQSGHYVLSGNLAATPNSSCLTIHDTHDVYLDCQQHAITIDRHTDPGNSSAVAIMNVNGYSIANCQLTAFNTNSSVSLAVLMVTASPLGTVKNNVIGGGYISFYKTDRLEFSHNTLNAPLGISGSNATIEYNTIALAAGAYVSGSVLTLSNSTGSLIQNNVLDGGWDGVLRQSYNLEPGSDDGILLTNVSAAIIQNNTIRNTWDAGIENVGTMVNVQVLNNQIATAGNCGMGAWYGDGLNNVTITGNTVADTPMLFDYWRADGLYVSSGEQKVLFEDNTFSGNSLVRPRLTFAVSGSARLDFQNLPSSIPAGAVVAARNKISNNDFGPLGRGVRLLPASSFMDGGGNTCIPDTGVAFPLNCTPPLSGSGGYYALAASPVGATIAPGTSIVVLFGANPANSGDYIGLAAVGASDQQWISTQNTNGSGSNALIFTAPAVPGKYELRYMKAGITGHVAVSNSLIVDITR